MYTLGKRRVLPNRVAVTSRPASSRYPLVIAGVTFLVLLVVAGIRSASGVLLVPLEHAMGWSVASISVAVAINVALYGAIGPFAAAYMEKFGLRRMILVALALMAISTVASTFVMTPLQLALTWGVGVGLGIGVVSMVLGAIVSTRWFAKGRGVVYGALTGSAAAGQLVFLPLLAWTAQAYGWRTVGFVCAATAVLVAIPVALFMRDRPESIGITRFGEDASTAVAAAPVRHSKNPLRNTFAVLGRASRKRDFWLVSGTFFICGATTNGYIGTHFMAICGDVGITQVHAAGLVAVIGLFSMIGSTASGWLSDRFESRYLLFIFYGLRGLSLFILPFAIAGVNSAYILPAFMVFYGLDWLATGAPNIRALTEALGKEDVPIAFGWVCVAHQIGAGSSALLAGVIRTNTGSYASTYELYGAFCIVGAIASLGIGAGRRNRRASATGRAAASSQPVPA
jgi:predicted MFS family arabinose efflux permease